MNWYLKVLKQYSDYSGRARRKEYWMFFLFNMIFAICAAVLDNVLGLTFKQGIPYGFLYLIYALFMFIPGLAVAVRRLHDVGKSGWWYFIALVPLIGGIWLIVLFATEGTRGNNEYGADPKSNYSEINEIGQKEI